MKQTRAARITWNSLRWRRPSGMEGKDEISYVTEHGFGFEEWLNRKNWTIEGLRYSHIESIGYSREKLKGDSIDVILFSILDGRHYQVGSIKNCHVLTDDEALQVYLQMRKYSAHKTMIREVIKIGGDHTKITSPRLLKHPDWFYNIRFHPNDLKIKEKPILIPSDNAISKVVRYSTLAYVGAKSGGGQPKIRSHLKIFSGKEGGKKVEKHEINERSRDFIAFVKAATHKRHGHLKCKRCNFDFYKKFGDLGYGFMEGHHLVPLSTRKKSAVPKPEDLVLLCSNCHRMAHRALRERPDLHSWGKLHKYMKECQADFL